MPHTADSIIEQARELCPSADPVRHPDPVAWRFLDRLERKLTTEIMAIDERAITAELSITLPLTTADFLNGYDLSVTAAADPLAYHFPMDAVLTNTDLRIPVRQEDYAVRHSPQFFPSCWIENGRLFLTGKEVDWNRFDEFLLTYTPKPGGITAGADTFDLPDSVEPVLVSELANFFAKRSKQEDLYRPRSEFQVDADAETARFLKLFVHRRGAQIMRVPEVY